MAPMATPTLPTMSILRSLAMSKPTPRPAIVSPGAVVSLASIRPAPQRLDSLFQTVGATILLLAILAFSGCQSVAPSPSPVALRTSNEAMFPTLKLNDDLFKTWKPSNNRTWVPEQARLAYAETRGDIVTVHNIRDVHWRTLQDFTLSYYDKAFDLNKIRSVDFIVVPFNETPSLGHTMLSFGFDGGEHLAVSVEIRKELGEAFNPIAGFFQQYEIIYIVASERDVIQRRVQCDLSDVFLYRSTATPEQARMLFVDVMKRVDKLAKEPEFYDTLTNNCTTNIRNHINHLAPNVVPYDYRVLLPGHSDKLGYDLGLIERHGSFEETRLRARVNYQAYLHRDNPDFSCAIRQ
jgi:hypothetical protein